MAGNDCRGEKETMKRAVDVAFAIVAVIVITLAVISISRRRHVESMMCGNYISSIGLATEVWAQDNHNILPNNFIEMSNELTMTKILICPGDRTRQPAKDFASLTPTNSSYVLLTPGVPWNDTNAFLRCQVHGHLGYADGTVFDGKQRRSKIFPK
jgi:hypothetical protein